MTDYSSKTPFLLPGPGLGELSGSNGVALRAAISAAQLGTGPCHIIFLGNSVTQRYLATTAPNGYANKTMSGLASRLGLTNPPGYYPASTDCNYSGMTYTPSGTSSLVDDSGFCGEALYWQAGTTLTSVTINPATGFWIHCQKGPAIGAQFTYSVNGGAAQGPVNAGAAPRQGGRIWDHGNAGGLASGGANTIVFTSDVTFGSVVEGVTWFNGNHNTTRPQGFITRANANTGTGLRHWICGHSGYYTSRYTVAGFNVPVTGSANSQATFVDPMDFIDPHLMIIELGINDINQGISVQTFIANLQTMVAMIRAKITTTGARFPTLIFMAMYGSTLDSRGQYSPQAQALKAYCYANGYGFLDLTSLMGGSIVGNTTVSSDAIHPNDVGHQMIANYLVNMILDT